MKAPRYHSLDVFRGATVALMILVNNPGSWSHIYAPLQHAPWNGLTPTDLVFPFFLFAVGNAMAFVLPRLRQGGDALFWRKVLKRSLIIFAIGLFLNWWPFVRWEGDALLFNGWTRINAEGGEVGVRIFGVLQRIALCYLFASVIAYYAKPRGVFLLGALLLLAYWGICIAGNPSDPYSLTGWWGTALDKTILGAAHMYRGEGVVFDPEGLASTLPAVVQVLFGFLVGHYIITLSTAQQSSHTRTPNESGPERAGVQRGSLAEDLEKEKSALLLPILTGLFVSAVALLVAGYAWGLSFPVNKKIWTSSYTVVTTGMAIALLATLIWAIELKGVRAWWTRFFDVFGKNALFVFALSAFLPKGLSLLRIPMGVGAEGKMLYTNPWRFLYDKVYKFVPGDPRLGSLLFALTVILFMWAVCWWMDKKKIYVKV